MRHKPVIVLFVLLFLVFLFAGNGFQLAKTLSTTVIVPDDSPTIQGAINEASDGDTIFVTAGTYYEHVVVNKTVSLIGENVGTTIIDGNDTGHVIYIVCDNVTMTGFTVRNSGHTHMPDLNAGICLNGTTGCNISGNRVIDNGFSGIQILYSQYNRITGNNVSGTEWGAIHILGSSRNTVSKNILESNGYVGINGHAGSHYNNVTNNVIFNSTHGMFYHNASYNSICRNNISAISVEGIWLQDIVSHNIVAENSLVNCTVAIILEGPNTNNTLSGNFITGGEYGIKILNAQSNRVLNNIIVNNRGGSDLWRAGIRLEGGGYSHIHSNLISGNYYGVLLYSNSPYVSVYENNISYNEFGLRIASGGSSYLNATKNIVTNNVGYGIGLTGFTSSSNYAVLTNNTIINNSQGVSIGQYSNFNTVVQNYIEHNDYGFYLEYSIENMICHNILVSNDQQVYVESGSASRWDNDYPYGGNYWSDYVSLDSFNGPYQNMTGGDGIGDNPRVIDANNKDNYPFMLLSICNVSQVPEDGIIPPAHEVKINATITHLYSVEQAILNCTIANNTGMYSFSLNMANAEDDVWNATIPAFPTGTNVTYIIIGQDSEGNTINSQQQGYALEYQVVPEFPLISMLTPLAIVTLLIAISSKHKTRKNPRAKR